VGNSLGAMVFLASGIAFGYWALTGKAQNFLHTLNTGQGMGANNPAQPAVTGPVQGVQLNPSSNPYQIPDWVPTVGSGLFNENGPQQSMLGGFAL
jgi:hypothetical protein